MRYSVGSLLKIFGIATVLYGVDTGLSYAAGGISFDDDGFSGGGLVNTGSGTSAYVAYDATSTPGDPDNPVITTIVSNVKTLCPAGQYVYKCGNYKIGFNWLKSMPMSNTYTEENCSTEGGVWNSDSSTCDISTKNYYISNDQSELLDQMRAFFGGTESSIERCKTWSDNSCTERELTDKYLKDRYYILMTVCNPFDSNTAVTCAYCPNSANIEKSTVKIKINTLTNVSSAENWNFHTIADCYIKEFSDSTGTYIYVNDSGSWDTNPDPEICYYTNTNPEALNLLQGDSIEGFASGTNTAKEPVLIAIPTSDLPTAKTIPF